MQPGREKRGLVRFESSLPLHCSSALLQAPPNYEQPMRMFCYQLTSSLQIGSFTSCSGRSSLLSYHNLPSAKCHKRLQLYASLDLPRVMYCLLYTSDAADDLLCV